ncbi:molybdenum cofactor synthesis protein [bacterium]|nr:molybdenum cofactor synthesis protein [bacterium]
MGTEHKIKIISVCVSDERGTVKHPVDEILIGDEGIVGDAHYGHRRRQVSILAEKSKKDFEAHIGKKLSPGEAAENMIVSGINPYEIAFLDRFLFESVILEVTQIGKKYDDREISSSQVPGKPVMCDEGIFCRVLSCGVLRPGDVGVYLPRHLRIKIITVSDRASAGEYVDRSGAEMESMLSEFFASTRWRAKIDREIVPDDKFTVDKKIRSALDDRADIIFTTGGTGLGSRDITTDVVSAVLQRQIPGIMEYIRVKYGAENPNALLSRSVAGIAEKTIIFALPGSTKAVKEYITEILKVIEHIIFTVNDIDVH